MKVYEFNNLRSIINDLKSGKLLIIPTDTIYGFSCSKSTLEAKKRIFNLKKRDEGKSLLILVSSIRMMKKLVFVNKQIKNLVRISSSTTIICHKKFGANQKNNNKTLAIRVIKWKWLKKIIKKTGPLYSTSVNISNKSHAVSIEEIKQFAVDGYVNYVYQVANQPSKIYDAILNKYIR